MGTLTATCTNMGTRPDSTGHHTVCHTHCHHLTHGSAGANSMVAVRCRNWEVNSTLNALNGKARPEMMDGKKPKILTSQFQRDQPPMSRLVPKSNAWVALHTTTSSIQN